ncbi:Arc family DNA-binding protein [Rhodanobacter sp. 115]|uniref:Arc family DNA-binding protein n=1 Tax=Rhodanobacter sp. FW021-MT20 TaxID=1162282 RepID=UPI000260D255|nr:Arc-like DNA binding domain protein [Rhodanobacter sp. 115]
MATKFPSDQQDKFMLRLPDGMREQIAGAAKANNRSMNAEIVARLQDGLNARKLVVTDDQGREIDPSKEDVAMFAFLGAMDDLKRAVSAFEDAKHAIAKAVGVAFVESAHKKPRTRRG